MIRTYSAQFTRTFGNVLFAVCLLAAWAILTLIGVVVEQGRDAAVYFTDYAPPLARLVLRLGFDNVYHSPAYVAIIGLILLSLAVCTFKRVIPARLPPLRPVRVEHIPLNATISVAGPPADVRTKVEQFFRARGWQLRKREFGGAEWTFADKHNWARRGVLVAHVGFVIIAAGTTIYWARGFSGESAIVAGQTVQPAHTHAAIRLDDFRYTIAPTMTKGGMVYQPVDYVSHVTVWDQDRTPRRQTIRVNHPMDVDGTLFYQSSYGYAIRFGITHAGTPVTSLAQRVYLTGDSFTIPGTGRTVTFAQFVPTVDRATGQPSADPRINDPAVALEVRDAEQPVGAALVPMKTWIDIGGGWRITPQRYLMVTGLQYRYDPGVPLVGIGAFVLLAGLVISFYLLPARLFVRVDPSAAGSTVAVAATTVKGYDIFSNAFEELAHNLEGALNPAAEAPALALARAT